MRLLRGFCALFPSVAQSRLIEAYLRYNSMSDTEEQGDDEGEDAHAKDEEEIDEDALMTAMMVCVLSDDGRRN